MPHEPTIEELIDAVRDWIKAEVMPGLDGYAQFRGRVALGMLSTVQRELAKRPEADAAALARLQDLLGEDASLAELEARLCERIAAGELGLDNPALMAHLRQTTVDRLAIDQPKLLVGRDAGRS